MLQSSIINLSNVKKLSSDLPHYKKESRVTEKCEEVWERINRLWSQLNQQIISGCIEKLQLGLWHLICKISCKMGGVIKIRCQIWTMFRNQTTLKDFYIQQLPLKFYFLGGNIVSNSKHYPNKLNNCLQKTPENLKGGLPGVPKKGNTFDWPQNKRLSFNHQNFFAFSQQHSNLDFETKFAQIR